MDKLRSIHASAYAASAGVVVTVILTLAAELSESFKTWLAVFTGHHWVSKSWVSIIIFAIFFIFVRASNKNPDSIQTRKSLFILELAIIAGFIIILGFFTLEFFKH